MAVFEEEILKPEEQESGFNPGEPDDDTFSLKNEDDYPGELPDFSDKKADDIKQTLSEIVSEKSVNDEDSEQPDEEQIDDPEYSTDISSAEVISADEGESVWDKYDDEPVENETSDEIDEDLFNIPEAEESETDTIEDDDLPTIEEVGASIDPEDKEEISDERSAIDNIDEESFEVDDELKNMIQSELDKGKERAAKKQQTEQLEEQNKKSKEEFIPVNESGDTADSFDLGSLDEEISKLSIDETIKAAQEQKDAALKEAKKSKERPIESDKQKSKKGIIFWTAAATFLITLGLGYGYLKFFTDFFNTDAHKTEIVAEDSTASHDNPIAEDHTAKDEHDEHTDQKVDSASHDEHKEANMSEKEHIAENQIHENKTEEHSEKKEEPKKVEHKTQHDVKKVEKEATHKVASHKNVTKPETKKEVTHKPKKQRETSKTEKKVEPNRENITEDIVEQTFIEDENIDDEGVYIVQIYATPSKDDAEDWLDKLNNKNIDNAFISTKKVRGKTLYRVRFGNYRSKEEARTAALKYGFAQTWIDRVK